MPAGRAASFVLSIVAGLAIGGRLPASDRADSGRTETPALRGSFAWVSGDELDLIGELGIDLPLPVRDRHHLYFALDTRTEIRRASSDVTFDVRDLAYRLELGWRMPADRDTVELSAFAGQSGKERVDADGEPFIRYVGAGVESEGWRRPRAARSFEWSAALAAVVDERELDADGLLRGALRLSLPGKRVFPGFDVSVDALVGGTDSGSDLSVGPRLDVPLPGGPWTSFFLHYLRGRNPLGPMVSGVLAGFEYSERPGAPASHADTPGIEGSFSFGGGGGRDAGRLRLQFYSPALARGVWLVGDFDLNALTAADTGELYYLYHVGLETGNRLRRGVSFYHRSNHRLAEPGGSVTSINVVEAGVETPGWTRAAGSRPPSRRGTLDGRVRAGWLVDSSFGEDRSWHARGGLRWVAPGGIGPFVPFVVAEFEEGDVRRRIGALGLAYSELDLRVEYRNDDQFFGSDATAVLVLATVAF